ncbi:MAG: hypothetical protein GTO45_05295 [Candidatus Aminicenantes bacterium]|nr:hypothetical protein [Candidatus Aminicenantes bacterium]NIM78164.1 hypothetical protein [Candidatus Aminicenantes bacterium]NIN17500.1 hypothetical protein [Candidatus Aminicenantes bacterium]NIN41386.1 hypothetical protein [Candidatus Aminicenantes bacterium]NIN84152.1 hypothetical protein [Candidatus Aminicenantes bacterium]
MHWLDFVIFGLYMLAVLGIGVYFFKKNKDNEDYYVGGRSISALHVGLSIAATDVGGGFSIGLGGLGYMIGLSGSWLLFTGIVGAWLSAVLIIPKIKKIDARHKLLTFPDFLRLHYPGDENLSPGTAPGNGSNIGRDFGICCSVFRDSLRGIQNGEMGKKLVNLYGYASLLVLQGLNIFYLI